MYRSAIITNNRFKQKKIQEDGGIAAAARAVRNLITFCKETAFPIRIRSCRAFYEMQVCNIAYLTKKVLFAIIESCKIVI